MIAILKHSTTEEQLNNLCRWLEAQGLSVHLSRGKYETIVGMSSWFLCLKGQSETKI